MTSFLIPLNSGEQTAPQIRAAAQKLWIELKKSATKTLEDVGKNSGMSTIETADQLGGKAIQVLHGDSQFSMRAQTRSDRGLGGHLTGPEHKHLRWYMEAQSKDSFFKELRAMLNSHPTQPLSTKDVAAELGIQTGNNIRQSQLHKSRYADLQNVMGQLSRLADALSDDNITAEIAIPDKDLNFLMIKEGKDWKLDNSSIDSVRSILGLSPTAGKTTSFASLAEKSSSTPLERLLKKFTPADSSLPKAPDHTR